MRLKLAKMTIPEKVVWFGALLNEKRLPRKLKKALRYDLMWKSYKFSRVKLKTILDDTLSMLFNKSHTIISKELGDVQNDRILHREFESSI